ncbi:DEAD/DEAH box helicase [Ferrimonas sp. YFM]|uniref:DEAD/DEAH box helicase n=1 Tax=Ferrimonas sp. YFM TaxID=3028878 RepID=UPI002572C95A|nr:DEAD/DEAH box helicase [Ferrimonas sp. YFM]BDY03525.1 ATP-dependent RNA helicase DeaD [Ferrimonas sp. YFM]
MSDTTIDFAGLNLPAPLLAAVTDLGFTAPTPIQAQAIPYMIEGNDILGEAQTGTGKTAAFGLPGLARIDPSQRHIQMLVLAPTRELAIQVAKSLEEFAVNLRGLRVTTLYGGQPYGPQLRDLERGCQVVVATPGRLMDHIRRGSIDLEKVSCCVLDEADEMLNMGFLEDIEWILEHLDSETQMALFSATMPQQIRRIAQRFLKDPKHVKIAADVNAKANITQKAWKVTGVSKQTALERLAETLPYDAMIVFVRTRGDTVDLAAHLNGLGFKAAALNGDMSQQQREHTVAQLHKGRISILIATDVVARGLDVPRITHVVNYDLPMDSESYVHRIGRTGRAGREGEAILFARPREMRLLRTYERQTKGTIIPMDLPTAEELGRHRVGRLQEELTTCIDERDLEELKGMLTEMAEKTEKDILSLAAALLFERQRKKPLKPKPDPEPRFERRERSERRDRDGDDRRPRRENINFDTYRLAVGREHGAQVKDIVGALANELQLESRLIGQIRLFDAHTLVQLPQNMPPYVQNDMRKIRIRNRQIDGQITSEQIPPRDRDDNRRPRRDGEFRGRRDGEFRGRRNDGDSRGRRNDGEFRGRREDGEFRPRRNDGEFRPRRNDGEFRGRREDGEFRGRRNEGGYQGKRQRREFND